MMLAGRGIAGIGGKMKTMTKKLTATAAGCFVLTRIIMSDTQSLRENSTQNTFLALMYAIAYSIGPVHFSQKSVNIRSLEECSLLFPGDGALRSIFQSALSHIS
jgi:hypothetical protein